MPAVALITGGSRGIGRAIVHEAARRGFTVLFSYRERSVAADEVVQSVAAAGGTALAVRADLAEPAAVEHLASAARAVGTVGLLVNNAGVLHEQAIETLDPARWADAVAVNLTAPCFLVQAVLADLRAAHGSVLNISSSGGVTGSLHGPAYGATKAGIIGLTRTLARELAPSVRVNCLAPGPVRTEMYDQLPASQRAEVEATTPLRRVADPVDIARAALDISAWPDCTGQVVVVDGGRVM